MALESSSPRLSPPTWLSVLAWIYLMACGFRVISNIAQGTFGYDPLILKVGFGNLAPVEPPMWWALIHIAAEVGLSIGCLAVLLRDRDLVWFIIIGGWAVAFLQSCDAFIGIFHLRFAIPLSAFVFAAMAWRASSLLRVERPESPRSLGTI